jgi:ribosomal protein S18 acetylase RimI-like enzyme
MQDLVSEAWRLEGPVVAHHPGGLAWSRFHLPDRGEPHARLWEEEGAVAAWGWIAEPAELHFQVHPRRRALLSDVLSWFEREDDAAGKTVWGLLADQFAVTALEARGFRPDSLDRPHFVCLTRALEDLPHPSLPPGFALRHVRAEDLERRVAVHRAAWHPSRVTVESFRAVTSAYPYRPELYCVVEAPDGSFAASCLMWLDPASGAGELEPVGTDPRFARQGLAAAVCTFALRQLRDHGGRTAVVYPRGDDGHSAARHLYESLGFRASGQVVPFRRS